MRNLVFINIATITNIDRKNDKLFSLNIGNNAIFANAVRPVFRHVTFESFSIVQRVWAFKNTIFDKINNTFLIRIINFLQGFIKTGRKFNLPFRGHGVFQFPLGNRLQAFYFSVRLHIHRQRRKHLRIDQGRVEGSPLRNNSWGDASWPPNSLNVFLNLPEVLHQPYGSLFTKIIYRKYNMFYKKIKLNVSNKLTILGLAVTTALHADMAGDMKNFFNTMGTASNISQSSSFSDQSGGYYTGGSLTARTGSRSAQLATIQMPGYRAGCGGIDAWLGGFSHINKEQLMNTMKNIGSSAMSYAFMLAVQSTAPQIANIMNELNAIATTVNNMNINSCEAAATMVGSVWPKSDQASQHLCKAMGNNLGTFSDYADARHGCGTGGKRGSTLGQKNNNDEYKDMLVGSFNIAWAAIQKNAFLAQDRKLAEAFMSIVGSIIVNAGEQKHHVQMLPAMADSGNLLDAMLNGGPTQIYNCEDDACLKTSLQTINIPADSALFHRVDHMLSTLVDKIYSDDKVTNAELAFLNSTSLPVYKMLNVMTAYRKGHAPVNIQNYSGLIAMDIVMQYVVEIIDIVQVSVLHLKAVQVDDTHMNEYLKSLREVRARIVERRSSAFTQMDATLNMIQTTKLMEKQLHVMLSGVANDTNYL